MVVNQKDWWAPVWRGLVMDKEGKHYRKMRSGIWLFLYLLLNANRRSGLLYKKIKTVSSDTGWNRDMILRWLNILRRSGYIATKNTGRCLLMQIRNWKGLSEVPNQQAQGSEISNSRGDKNPTSQRHGDNRKSAQLSQKGPDPTKRNEIILKRDKYNESAKDLNSFKSDFHSFKKLGEILKNYLRTQSRHPLFNLFIKKHGQKTPDDPGN